jgi:HEAT repeat protein
MKTATRLLFALLVATPLFAANWIGWSVPTRHDVRVNYNGRGNSYCSSGGRLVVAVKMNKDAVEDLRLFDPVCEPDFDGLTIEMRTMTPVASIDWLAAHLSTSDDARELVTAIALHEDEKVVPTLIPLARNNPDREVRRQAIFWLGQKAGTKAAAELRRAVDEDPDEDVRQHAVFAISQLPRDRAVPMLIDLVKTHKSREVRKRAMFWLAQTDDPRALDLIESILTR